MVLYYQEQAMGYKTSRLEYIEFVLAVFPLKCGFIIHSASGNICIN